MPEVTVARFSAVLLLVALLPLAGCGGDDEDDPPAAESGKPAGLIQVASARPAGEVIGELETAIMANDALSTIARVDHQADAESVDLELRPTELLLFGNPALGTRLMQENRLAGIDLPQKMLAWEDEAGATTLAYNSPDYLKRRHELGDDVDGVLDMIGGALGNLALGASGDTDGGSIEEPPDEVTVGPEEGVNTLVSIDDFETTYARLLQTVEGMDALAIAAQVDHAANAASVGEMLPPTRLLIFGNPAAGTPLMQSRQSIGIDLPLKVLVYEADDGDTIVAWNDPVFLAARHGIIDRDELVGKIAATLAGIAAAAAGTPVDTTTDEEDDGDT